MQGRAPRPGITVYCDSASRMQRVLACCTDPRDVNMIPELSHAVYVWSSYAVFAVIVAWQFLQPLIRRRRLVRSMIEAEAERRAARRNQQ